MTKQENTKTATDTAKSSVANINNGNAKHKSIMAKPIFTKMVENADTIKANDGKKISEEIASEYLFMHDNIEAQLSMTFEGKKPAMVYFLEKQMDVCAETINQLQGNVDWRIEKIAELSSDEGGFTTKVSDNDEIKVSSIREHKRAIETLKENMDQVMYLGTLLARLGKDMCLVGIHLTSKLDRWNSYEDSMKQKNGVHAIKKRKRN